MAGTAAGDIAEHLRRAGATDVADGSLEARADYVGFDDFWEPLTLEIGPAGRYLASLDNEQREAVRTAARAKLPDGPFTLDARAWYGCGRVP